MIRHRRLAFAILNGRDEKFVSRSEANWEDRYFWIVIGWRNVKQRTSRAACEQYVKRVVIAKATESQILKFTAAWRTLNVSYTSSGQCKCLSQVPHEVQIGYSSGHWIRHTLSHSNVSLRDCRVNLLSPFPRGPNGIQHSKRLRRATGIQRWSWDVVRTIVMYARVAAGVVAAGIVAAV